MSNSAAIQKASWKLEGDPFEGCNCNITYPCMFLSDSDEGNCYVTCTWHIQKGNYGNLTLDNLNVVAMFHTPGNMVTGPKWKAALYIDDRAFNRTDRCT
jgi:hypothetical protein